MDEPDIRYLLHAVQVDLSRVAYTGGRNTTRWMNIRCPFAPWRHQGGRDNTPSFGVTINEDGRSHYKCFSCQSKGRLAQLPSQLGALRKRDYSEQRRWAEMQELQASISRPLPNWEDADPVEAEKHNAHYNGPGTVEEAGYPRATGHPYLRARGIDFRATLLCDLRYDPRPWERRILFPVYGWDESFVGFTGRSTLKGNDTTRGDNPKVKDYYRLPKREVFLRLPKKDRRGRRIIVEGLFDYARLVGFGYRNAHAILGTSLTDEKIDILVSEGEAVYFLMDNDLAGWQALFGTYDEDGKHETEQAWAYRLYREVPVFIVPYKTIFDGTDPGTLSAKDVSAGLSRAWLFTGNAPVKIERSRAGKAEITRLWKRTAVL